MAALLDPTDHSMAVFYERLAAGTLHASPQYGVRAWNGLYWQDDSSLGLHRDLALETVHALMDTATTILIPAAMTAPIVAANPLAAVEDVELALRKRMRAGLKRYERSRNLSAMIEMAHLRRPTLLPIDAFDRDPLLLTVANGVLDLRAGTLAPACPEQRLTKALAVAFDPAAACPRFLQFLTELFPEDTAEMIGFLQRLVGLCLTGVIRDHLLPIFWGEGSNGKTTLLRVLQALLGPFLQVAPLSLLLDSRQRTQIPNDIARLAGVRCVVVSETPSQGRLNEERVKVLTGNDRLTGRFLHREFFDFDPTHKVLLVTNHKPIIHGQDHAIWRRVALVPFIVRFWKPEDHPPPDAPLADPLLYDVLVSELPGILTWAVAGCVAWQQTGRLRLPRLVRVATGEYQVEQDVLGPFLESCCVVDRAAWVEYPLPVIVAAIRTNRGMVAKAARSLGCKRDTIYRAAERHAIVREALEDEREVRLDEAEQALFKAIDAGESWAVCFFLKCQGKRRGYVERQEISTPEDSPLRVDHAVRVYYLPDNGRGKLAVPMSGEVVEATAKEVEPEPEPVPVISLPDNGRPD